MCNAGIPAFTKLYWSLRTKRPSIGSGSGSHTHACKLADIHIHSSAPEAYSLDSDAHGSGVRSSTVDGQYLHSRKAFRKATSTWRTSSASYSCSEQQHCSTASFLVALSHQITCHNPMPGSGRQWRERRQICRLQAAAPCPSKQALTTAIEAGWDLWYEM